MDPRAPHSLQIDGVHYGARAHADGPAGGGPGYLRLLETGVTVADSAELLHAALAEAQAGDTVFVPGHVEIDLTEWVYTDEWVLRIPAGVTLASDRGRAGSPGALLYSDAMQTRPLIAAMGDDVRVTGLRLRGPDPHRRLRFHHRVFVAGDATREDRAAAYYRLPNSGAINTTHDRLEVDNCEISAWSHYGVYLQGGVDHQVHHCSIHHCQRMGLGYGITIGAATARIYASLFQDNKHHVAGTGAPGSGYELYDCIVLPHTESHAHPHRDGDYGQDHVFDMHGGRDRGDGTDIAGDRIDIHHNTVYEPYLPVHIRGIPQTFAHIHHNWFPARTPDTTTVISDGNTTVTDNAHGPDGEIA